VTPTPDGLDGERGKLCYASPAIGNGIVVAAAGYMGPAIAVRTDGSSDLPRREPLWRATERNPQRIGSGVVVGDCVFIANADGGSIQCLDLNSGRERWRQRVSGGPHWASTVFAGGLLFATNRSGTTRVFRPNSARFELVAENALDEAVSATPAFSGRDVLIRTEQSLYCISMTRPAT
jgi:outer membrane protein assembly factor BamB